MRKILFRCKRADDGKWFMSSLMAFSWHDLKTFGQYTGINDIHGTPIFEGDIVRDMRLYLTHRRYAELGQETLEQAELYSYVGDIDVVKFSTEDVGSCGCCYDQFEGSGFIASGVNLHKCKVIGNIYDNPELMKRKGDTDGEKGT